MRFSFSRVHKSYTYWTIISLFGIANLWSALRYLRAGRNGLDDLLFIGFPFPFYVSGGAVSRNGLLVTGALLDLVVAWTAALIAAWIALSWQRKRHEKVTGSAGGQQQARNVDAGVKTQEPPND